MSEDKIFIDGLIFKAPPAGAPDFVKGRLSVKVSEFAAFCQANQRDGWLNIDLKESQAGKYYAELNTWKPTDGQVAKQGMAQATAIVASAEISSQLPPSFADDDIPF